MNKLNSFWKQVVQRRDPRIRNHPICLRDRWSSLAIPISLHGDAVPAVSVGKAGSKSYDCYSWQSVLSHGVTTAIKVYICGLFEDCKGKSTGPGVPSTMAQIWKVIVWSLKAACAGTWPSVDHNGDAYPAHSTEASRAGTKLADGFSWYLGP